MKDRIERAIDVANMIDAGPSERIIMLALIVRAGDSLKATMSHAEMSDWCGLTTRTVLTAMKELVDSGAVEPTSEKRARRGAPNTYDLVFLQDSYAPAAPAAGTPGPGTPGENPSPDGGLDL
jgi:pantothenate kinase